MRIPYRWIIVGVGALVTCVAIGSMFSLAVFLGPMSASTGWGRATISTAMTLDFLIMGFAGFAWGTASDRFGARIVVLSGAVLLGTGLVVASRATTPLAFRLGFGVLVGLAAAGLAGCGRRAPRSTAGPTARPSARYSSPTPLPTPEQDGRVSLEQAIARRRSARTFGRDPLTQAMIGQLLWAGQGITDPDGKRAAPSAGALYPIELYVVTSSQVMHYLPHGHRVETRETADLRPQLRAAAVDQDSVAAAPAVLVIAAQPDRTEQRYGSFADAFVNLEAGHVAQNILLTAAAHELAAVPVGSLDTARCAQVLARAPGEDVHYLIPVGHPASH